MMNRANQPVRKWHLAAAFVLLLLTTLACGFGSPDEPIEEAPTAVPSVVDEVDPAEEPAAEEPTAAPEAEPTEEVEASVPQNNTAEVPLVPTALSGDQRETLASGTVFIAMLSEEGDDRFIIGSGSGTIISEDGLILTNAHVARPSAIGFAIDEDPDILGVAIVENADEPPVPTYLAEVVAVDGVLDLAVLRISSTLDGSRIDPTDLGLSVVAIGNSDDVRLGDNVNIFGFPGIGGETITFTKGSVSGFSSQEQVGNRAWIKTDATIAGGNSGGLATNDFGEIIGIPTRASSGENQQVTDCRVVQDTNGDGRLTDDDNCIPIGGFINALRPIKLAMPLIRAAQAKVAYESPYGIIAAEAAGNGQESFPFVTWSTDFDDNGCAVDPVTNYPTGVDLLVAVFAYSGLTEGQEINVYWLLDGEIFGQDQFEWDGGSSGECLALWFRADEPFPEGEYAILIYTGEDSPLAGEASTTVGAGTFVNDGVTVSGRILDADTGRGIPRANIIILNAGVDIDIWLNNPVESDIYTSAQANRAGDYVLPRPLIRGERYDGIAFADGYDDSIGYLEFEENDEDEVIIDLELTR